VYRYASRVEEKMASSQLTFEHGWLRLELINMEADMSFSSEYWTYWRSTHLPLVHMKTDMSFSPEYWTYINSSEGERKSKQKDEEKNKEIAWWNGSPRRNIVHLDMSWSDVKDSILL
jgi:hypothetical protein